jgi:hypothetical protein
MIELALFLKSCLRRSGIAEFEEQLLRYAHPRLEDGSDI